jgi:methyl-accepting chemotaxis protein
VAKFYAFLNNMSIVRRLLYAVLVAAVIPGSIIIILGISYFYTLSNVNDTVRASDNAVSLVTGLQADLLRMNALVDALSTGNANSQSEIIQINSEIVQLTGDFDQKLSTYSKDYQIVSSDGMKSTRDMLNGNGVGDQVPISQHAMIFVVDLQWQEYKKAQTTVLSDSNPQKPADATTLSTDVAAADGLYLPLKGNLDNLVNLTESLSQNVVQANTEQAPTIIWGAILAFLCSTLVVLFIGFIVNQTITKPLQHLAQLAKRITKGETTARATISGNDEIYMVAISINAMLDNIVYLMQKTQKQHDDLQSRIEQLIQEVSGIAKGNLDIRIMVTSDALGVLAQAFNFMINELSGLIVHVKEVAQNVKNLTGTTVQHMAQLVQDGDQQVQQIADSEREIEQMADQIRQVSERAHVLFDIASLTRQIAQKGRIAVQQAGAGISRIHENVQSTGEKVKLLNESSRQINDIVEVISNVAYHTNRLALDASVQATAAGENGHGFATIASDIRRLSEQTKAQTIKIARLIQTVNENIGNVEVAMTTTKRETDEGMNLALQTSTALESIFDAVDRQAKEIEGINEMATRQLQSSRSIVRSMQNISRATQASGASTHMTSQNMWRLSHLVEQLRVSVEAFKLRQGRNSNFPVTPPPVAHVVHKSTKLQKMDKMN